MPILQNQRDAALLRQYIIEACWGSFLTLLGFSSFMAVPLQYLYLSNLLVPNGAIQSSKWSKRAFTVELIAIFVLIFHFGYLFYFEITDVLLL